MWRGTFSLSVLVVSLAAACAAHRDIEGDGATAAPVRSVQSTGPTSPSPSPNSPRPTGPKPCVDAVTGFGCTLAARLRKVDGYLAGRPGLTGVVLRDRTTGATWANDNAQTRVWAASTMKLAMTVDLFQRDREGLLTLTPDDRVLIHQMLEVSDDAAASVLWDRYGGAAGYFPRFAGYGLTTATFVAGYPHRWGRIKCTAADLTRLITYVLEELPGPERAYIVGELRTVAANQQWGVWAAGPAARPGNKNGWTQGLDGVIAISSVGFAGPGARYTLAMMGDVGTTGSSAAARETLSGVAALLFR